MPNFWRVKTQIKKNLTGCQSALKKDKKLKMADICPLLLWDFGRRLDFLRELDFARGRLMEKVGYWNI